MCQINEMELFSRLNKIRELFIGSVESPEARMIQWYKTWEFIICNGSGYERRHQGQAFGMTRATETESG